MQYHYAIRRLRRMSDLIRVETLFEASLQGDCNLLAEMKNIRCGGSGRQSDLPDTVAGVQGEEEIVDKFRIVYETLYNSADTQAEMADLLNQVNRMIDNNSVQEVTKINGSKVKEAAGLLKSNKGDVSGGFSSDAILSLGLSDPMAL